MNKKFMALALLLFSFNAKATDMVIDIEALVSNAQQLQQLGQMYGVDTEQLANMVQQLQTANNTYDAVSGKTRRGGLSNGMINQFRQYLPQAYAQIISAIQNSQSAKYGNSDQYMRQYQTVDLNKTTIAPGSDNGQQFLTMAQLKAMSRAEYETAYETANNAYSQIGSLLDQLESSKTLKDSVDVNGKAMLMTATLQNEQNRLMALSLLNNAEKDLQTQKAQSNILKVGVGGYPGEWGQGSNGGYSQVNRKYSSDGTQIFN